MRAARATFEEARVVLDPVAVAELGHHLHVVLGALSDPVRLEHLPLRLEELDLLLELLLDLVERTLDRRLVGDVLRRREQREVLEPAVDLAGERVEVRDLLDLVPEEGDPVGGLERRRLHLDDVAADAKASPADERVVALVLDVDQLAEHHVPVDLLADGEQDGLLPVVLGRAEPVDAGDGGDDHDVAPEE